MCKPPSDGRSEPRIALNVEGPTLRVPGGSAAKVVLQDLSREGFRTEWPYIVRKGHRVWLKIPGFEIMAATVAWEERYTIGCKFGTPLHPTVLARVIALLKAR